MNEDHRSECRRRPYLFLFLFRLFFKLLRIIVVGFLSSNAWRSTSFICISFNGWRCFANATHSIRSTCIEEWIATFARFGCNCNACLAFRTIFHNCTTTHHFSIWQLHCTATDKTRTDTDRDARRTQITRIICFDCLFFLCVAALLHNFLFTTRNVISILLFDSYCVNHFVDLSLSPSHCLSLECTTAVLSVPRCQMNVCMCVFRVWFMAAPHCGEWWY